VIDFSSMEVVPLVGLGPVKFGMNRRQVKSFLGEKLTWEPWMGGNRNEDLYYVCGAVQMPQVLKLEKELTLGVALLQCGGLDKKAFNITVLRKRNDTFSTINIGLVAEVYKSTSYERIPLQQDDLIIVTPESS